MIIFISNLIYIIILGISRPRCDILAADCMQQKSTTCRKEGLKKCANLRASNEPRKSQTRERTNLEVMNVQV